MTDDQLAAQRERDVVKAAALQEGMDAIIKAVAHGVVDDTAAVRTAAAFLLEHAESLRAVAGIKRGD